MVSSTLCPAVHILGSQNVQGRGYRWPLLALGRLFSISFLLKNAVAKNIKCPEFNLPIAVRNILQLYSIFVLFRNMIYWQISNMHSIELIYHKNIWATDFRRLQPSQIDYLFSQLRMRRLSKLGSFQRRYIHQWTSGQLCPNYKPRRKSVSKGKVPPPSLQPKPIGHHDHV